MTRRSLVLVLATPPLVFVALAVLVFAWVRIPPPRPISARHQASVIATLRASVDRAATGADCPDRVLADGGALIVSFWLAGREVVRAVGRGASLRAACAEVDAKLRASPALARLSPAARMDGRLWVEIVEGRGPFPRLGSVVESLSVHPGIEGIGVSLGGREEYLLPHDLVRNSMVSSRAPIKLVDFKVGFDRARADTEFASRYRLTPAQFASTKRAYFRFRSTSFVERARLQRDRAPVLLARGVASERPTVNAATLRQAAIEGGRFLVAHLAKNGRYIYQVNLVSGAATDPKRHGQYSIPRHAGTTYFLAELYRLTSEEFLREPIERAFAHMVKLVEEGRCKGIASSGSTFACVVDGGQRVAKLGSTALTVVALVEHWRATGDRRYEPLAIRLGEWILRMQRPDGSFAHRYDVETQTRDESAQVFYYSGEAALALARLYMMTGSVRYQRAAVRAVDHLVASYDFFLGGFFFGEEHWTCIAAEALLPAIKKSSYNEFCRGYAEFLRRQQVQAGDFHDQDDLRGSYMFTPFAMPANTPVGSRSEAMISAYKLSAAHGEPDDAIRGQVLSALSFALGQQVRQESTLWAAAGVAPLGAISANPTDLSVRIDYVQHVGSALIRAVELMPPGN